MDYLLIAFGAFFVITTAQTYARAPDWFWLVLMLLLSLGGLWLRHDLGHWYGALAISGIGLLILRVENLLLIKTDEALARVRPRRT